MKTYSSRILDLCTRWRWLVSFTDRPLYPLRNGTRYPMDMGLNGPQNWSGRWGEENNFLPLCGIETPQPSHCTDWAISAPISSCIESFNRNSTVFCKAQPSSQRNSAAVPVYGLTLFLTVIEPPCFLSGSISHWEKHLGSRSRGVISKYSRYFWYSSDALASLIPGCFPIWSPFCVRQEEMRFIPSNTCRFLLR
jgi:hypothetical protein